MDSVVGEHWVALASLWSPLLLSRFDEKIQNKGSWMVCRTSTGRGLLPYIEVCQRLLLSSSFGTAHQPPSVRQCLLYMGLGMRLCPVDLQVGSGN